MTWQPRGDRLLVLCDGGIDTPWRIFKYGMPWEPLRYELWFDSFFELKFYGEFDSKEAAIQQQEQLACE